MLGLFEFFVPKSKIQKNRKILRDLDAHLAARCLKWVWLNLFVFLSTLIFSDFIEQSPILAYLGIVLFCFVCVARSVMITRFDQMYGGGPNRWRNRFFFFTLANNCLWGGYVAMQVYLNDVGTLTLMLVFYTASVANWYTYVFQGYLKLVRTTLTILLVPLTVVLISKLTTDGLLIGLIFLVGYLLLLRESESLYDSFWDLQERLNTLTEKNYELTKLKTMRRNNHHFDTDFLASIAYALRTPLNNLMGVMSLVDKTGLSKENLDLHKITNTSVAQLVNSINDLLDYTKILNKKIIIEENIFNLSRAIDEVMDDLAPVAHAKQVELIYDKTLHSLYRVKSDQSRLMQAITNVIDYAIHQSSEGGEVYVRFRMDRDGDKHSTFRVDISDRGEGLTEDEINKLFKPQYNINQLDDHQLENFDLGMAISKGIVEKMGGTVDACSVPKKGTNYWLNVSLVLSSQQTKSKPTYNPILEHKSFYLVGAEAHLEEVFSHRISLWKHSAVTSLSFAQLKERVLETSEPLPCDLIFINLPFDEQEVEDCLALISGHQSFNQYRYILICTQEQSQVIRACNLQNAGILLKTFSPDQIQLSVTDTLGLKLHVSEDVSEQSSKQDEALLANHSILLVEDNKVNQLVVKKMLGKLGANVDMAAHGEEALALLKENTYSLILMDCQMPVMDGFVSTEEIRKLPIKQVPIIALTAISTETCERKCYSVGMDDFLTKPVDFDDLQAKITQWLHEYEEDDSSQA